MTIKMLKSTFRCVIYPLAQPQVANQQQKINKVPFGSLLQLQIFKSDFQGQGTEFSKLSKPTYSFDLNLTYSIEFTQVYLLVIYAPQSPLCICFRWWKIKLFYKFASGKDQLQHQSCCKLVELSLPDQFRLKIVNILVHG